VAPCASATPAWIPALLLGPILPPPSTFSVEEITISQLHAWYLEGAVTAREVTQAYLDRIAAYDRRGPYLNSLISLNERALLEADALDAALRSTGTLTGPLHGVPVIVKDNIDAVELPTSCGVALFRDFIPPKDAFVIRRIRAAGAIVLAKASLSEMALGLEDNINSVLPGFTRNPYNTAYASGGSSGGTAVAITANLGAIGIGTDTGGSIRAPASATNLVGVRPTVGLVSRTGMSPLDSMRDTPGPMCRTVEDAARLLDVLAGVDPADPRTSAAAGRVAPTYTAFLDADGLRGRRIGVLGQGLTLRDGADPRVVTLLGQAIADLRAAGAEVVDDFTVPGFETFPWGPQTTATTKADWDAYFAYQGPTFPVKTVAQMCQATGADALHPLHAERIAEFAAEVVAPEDDPETIQCRRDEQLYRDAFGAAMADARVDALVFPIWTHPPLVNGDRGQSPTGPLTFVASITQWPAVAVPMGFVGEDLPMGLQFLGEPWSEGTLLALAYAYEQATQHRRPPVL